MAIKLIFRITHQYCGSATVFIQQNKMAAEQKILDPSLMTSVVTWFGRGRKIVI